MLKHFKDNTLAKNFKAGTLLNHFSQNNYKETISWSSADLFLYFLGKIQQVYQ